MDPLIKRRVFLNSAEEAAYNREQLERQEGETHGDILPLEVEDDGQVGWAFPQFMKDAWSDVNLPKQALQGYEYDEDDIAQFALDFGIAGGAARVAQGTAIDPNTASMFVGPKAKDANLPQLARAKMMEANGVSRDIIWQETGWWKKPDNKWAYEISDQEFGFTDYGKKSLNQKVADEEARPVNPPAIGISGFPTDILEHPRLKDQYSLDIPNTANVEIGFLNPDPEKRTNPNINFWGKSDPKQMKISAYAATSNQLKNVLLHEIQHGVQQEEGWELGANREYAEYFLSSIDKAMPEEWHTRNNLKVDREEYYKQLLSLINEKAKSTGDTEELDKLVKSIEGFIEELDGIIQGYDKIIEPYDKAYKEFKTRFGPDAFSAYRKNEGEVIANITTKRRNLTDEERKANPPWLEFGKEGAGADFINSLPWEEDIWSEETKVKK